MSNPFEITAQVLISTLPSMSLAPSPAPRPGPKPKPVSERRSLHALQLAHRDLITTATIDGLLTQFKADNPAEIDSNSNNLNIY
jgi:hypothetical protein